MGAKSKAAGIVLQNFAGAASEYFAGIPTPASIVSGACLEALFALPKFSEGLRTPTEKFLIKLYRLLTWFAFTLALNAVITCTIASMKILHGGFDPMAESGYKLLRREFEYEFVCTYWSFAVSLLCFITVVTIRFLLEFNLLVDEGRANTGKSVVFSSIALLAHLVSDLNETFSACSNLGDMTVALFRLIANKATEELAAMRVVAIVAWMGAFYFGCKSALSGGKKPSASEDGKDKTE